MFTVSFFWMIVRHNAQFIYHIRSYDKGHVKRHAAFSVSDTDPLDPVNHLPHTCTLFFFIISILHPRTFGWTSGGCFGNKSIQTLLYLLVICNLNVFYYVDRIFCRNTISSLLEEVRLELYLLPDSLRLVIYCWLCLH